MGNTTKQKGGSQTQVVGEIVKEYCLKFPKTPTRTLARMIYSENSQVFKDEEATRSRINYYRRTGGKWARQKLKDTSYMKADDAHNPFNLPEPDDSRQVLPFKLPRSWNSALILSDIHMPYHDLGVLSMAIEYGIKNNIPGVILNGDTMDFFAASKYATDPRKRNLGKEIEQGQEFVKTLSGLFKQRLWKDGNHECFDEETEVLTSGGWMRYDDITYDTLIATLDINTAKLEYQKPRRIITEQYNGEMLRINTSHSVDLLVTPNHRFVYRLYEPRYPQVLKVGPYKDLPQGNTDICFSVAGSLSRYDERVYTDDEVRIAAWFLAEGYQNPRSSNAHLYQSERKVQHIFDVLDRLGWEYTASRRVRDITSICGKVLKKKSQPQYDIRLRIQATRHLSEIVPDKYKLPRWVYGLNPDQFKIFIDAYVLADGTQRNGDNCQVVYCNNIDMLNQLQHVLVTHGYSATTTEYRNGDFRLNIVPGKNERRITRGINQHITREPYNGTVWCVETANDTVFVRRKGKPVITGNSRWKKYLWTKAPELTGVEIFELENILQLKEHGWIYVPDMAEIHAGNNFTIVHGHEFSESIYSPVNPARGLYLRFEDNAICGHYHRSSHHSQKTGRGKIKVTWSTGCLCLLRPEYATMNKWNCGFAIWSRESENDFHVRNFKIIDGKIYEG